MGCVGHVDTIVKYHIRREFCFPFKEEFENIKGAIRFCISKNRQHNGQKIKYKRTNNDLQYITNKTKDQVTQTPLKTGGVKIQNNLVISLWNMEISRKETLFFGENNSIRIPFCIEANKQLVLSMA